MSHTMILIRLSRLYSSDVKTVCFIPLQINVMNKGINSCINFVFIYTETPQQRLRIRKLKALTTGTSLQSAYHNLLREDPKISTGFYYALMYKLPVLYWKLQKLLYKTLLLHILYKYRVNQQIHFATGPLNAWRKIRNPFGLVMFPLQRTAG